MNSDTPAIPFSISISRGTKRPPKSVSPDVSRRTNLYHASVHPAETKRLILAERQRVLHRGTWMALSAMAEAITHLVVALDRLSARKRWRAKA